MNEFADLVGKTLTAIELLRDGDGSVDEMSLLFTDGTAALLYHEQECCEFVRLYEVIGNLDDLIGTPILKAEESSTRDDPPDHYHESWLWTFYLMTTIKGHVTLRWLGESNGYYSEAVDFMEIAHAQE